MDNYHPMYDTVGYHSSQGNVSIVTDSDRNEDKYAKLLKETQIQEDQSSAYQEPNRSYISGNRDSHKKSKCLIVGLVSIIIVLLSLAIVGIALTLVRWNNCNSNPSKETDTPDFQLQIDKCKMDTFTCEAGFNWTTYRSECQADKTFNLSVSVFFYIMINILFKSCICGIVHRPD